MVVSISTEISDAIVAVNEKFMAAFKMGDAAGIANLYTENGQLLPPNAGFLTGREAVQAVWQSILDMGAKEIKLDIVELEGYGDTAIETSTYTLYDESGQQLDQGKYIVIWKQLNGQWQLYRDIFNSSMPAS